MAAKKKQVKSKSEARRLEAQGVEAEVVPAKETPETPAAPAVAPESPVQVAGYTFTPEQFTQLVAAMQAGAPKAGAQVTGTGEVVGIQQVGSLDINDYPDPTAELGKLPELKRFAFEENFVLKFELKTLRYETKAGVLVHEPKFMFTLYEKHYDEKTGDWTGRFVIRQRLTLTHDPIGAQQVLSEMGINVKGEKLDTILNQARYEIARRWLLDVFKPAAVYEGKQAKEMVVGGMVMPVVDKEEVYRGQRVDLNEGLHE
jgi:hypothetical protein